MSERYPVHTYLILSKDSQLTRVIVWDTEEIRIGRHLEQDVVLENPEISRAHALLKRIGERFVAEDLKTSNGTFVNGERIETTGLAPNDRIQIGEWTIRFCQSRDDPAATLPNVMNASHLGDARKLAGAARSASVVGTAEDADPLSDGDFKEASLPVRDLDEEIEMSEVREKDGLPPIQTPPTKRSTAEDLSGESGPLAGPDFNRAEPLPPIGRATPDASRSGANEQSNPTFGSSRVEGSAAAGQSVEISLRLDGVDPELVQLLQSLRGKPLDLRALSMILKSIAVR